MQKSIESLISKQEEMGISDLKKLISSGEIVVLKNKNHKNLIPIAVGKKCKTKINANIGASPINFSLENELKKVKICEKYGADTIMDLSVTGNLKKKSKKGELDRFRQEIISNTYLPVGTVPVYQAVAEFGFDDFNIKNYLEVLERHCKDGISFATIHSGVTRNVLSKIEKRIGGVCSRGGGFAVKYMKKTGKENPLFEYFDEILGVLADYKVTISLGDGLRPGSINDSEDKAQLYELEILGELTQRARERSVSVIVEGPGHMPLKQIESHMKKQKKICKGAPFYVLGPLVTDVGAGYDHITSAIGGALAATYGADFLCYVTPSEHLGLPDLDDVKKGIIASRIAAHSADIAKSVPNAKDWDKKMSLARKNLDWEKMKKLSLDPEKFDTRKAKDIKSCSMCGDWCPLK